MTTVTAKMMSGAIAFGPEAVLKTITVRELKNLWDTGAAKDILFGHKLMQDHETLEELPLQAELTVAWNAEANIRAQDAAAALKFVDLDTMLDERRSNDRFSLEYAWCLMALEAVYGRDPAVWRECTDFGRIPTLPYLPHQCPSGQVRGFQTGCWPFGPIFPAEPLLDALRNLDHFAIERAMNTNIELRNEFPSLLAVHDLGSTPLGSWLEMSIKPLLRKR